MWRDWWISRWWMNCDIWYTLQWRLDSSHEKKRWELNSNCELHESGKFGGIWHTLIQPHCISVQQKRSLLFRCVVIDLYTCSRKAGGGDDGCSGQHGNLLDYGGLLTASGQNVIIITSLSITARRHGCSVRTAREHGGCLGQCVLALIYMA